MGAAGAGKDTCAAVLVQEFGYGRVAFADKVRELLLVQDPFIAMTDNHAEMVRLSAIIEEFGWDHAKRHIPEIRRLQQVFGTEVCRDTFGSDCWTVLGMQQANRVIEARLRPVFTDVRFPEEHKAIRESGGQIWLIERPDEENHAGTAHSSEQLFNKLNYDVRIVNNSSLENFVSMIRLHETMRTNRAKLIAENQTS